MTDEPKSQSVWRDTNRRQIRPTPDTAERQIKIDVAVHGRFHAFHLARALHLRGHDVQLLTNYPKNIVERFGFPGDKISTCLAHGIAVKSYYWLPPRFRPHFIERILHHWFGRWIRSKARRNADVVYVFSGIAEETLKSNHNTESRQIWVTRGSSHIRFQKRLLEEEEARTGVRVEKPSPWMIQREEREYALAKHIITLSSFAKESFISESVPAGKVNLLLLGVDVSAFRPNQETIRARQKRMWDGGPLRVVTVGTLSLRKGAWDLVEIARRLGDRMIFRCIGGVPEEAFGLVTTEPAKIEFVARVPERELVQHYAWGDVFLFPTIEDGFAAVLAQAQAAGLPVLTTPNSSGPDIVRHGQTGWILPIRSPSSFVEQLNWCDSRRAELANMVERLYSEFQQRDWNDMALDLERIYAATEEPLAVV